MLHLDQARRNLGLFRQLAQQGTHPEWAITLLFYAALRLVQAYFVQAVTTGTLPGDIPTHHGARNARVRDDLPVIRNHYRALYDFSIQARYEPAPLAPTAEELQRYEAELFVPIVDELDGRGVRLAP